MFFLPLRPTIEVTDGMMNSLIGAVTENVNTLLPIGVIVVGAFIGFKVITSLISHFTGT